MGIATGSEVTGRKGFDKSQHNNNNNIKVQNIQHGKYDYVPRTVTTEQLQYCILQKHSLFKVRNCNMLLKGDDDDDDDDDNNNNNTAIPLDRNVIRKRLNINSNKKKN